MDSVEVVSLIRTSLLRKGDGTKGNPVRIIIQYWTLEGDLVFEFDPEVNSEPDNVFMLFEP